MGCWNATCNVTNLPIYAGEKIVLIPLAKVKEECEFNVCYPADVFIPFGLPIIGEYDEYGGIEKVQTNEENKRHLMEDFNYFYQNSSSIDRAYKLAEKDEDFEAFVKNILCCHGGCYIKSNSSLHMDGMIEINYMMIHYGVYEMMLNEIANRKPYSCKENMLTKLSERIAGNIDKTKKTLKIHNDTKAEALSMGENGNKMFALAEAMIFNTYYDFVKENVDIGMLNPCAASWINVVRKMIDEYDKELLQEFVNMHLFARALSCLRKGFLCDSGAGSQSEETKMHYLVAKWTINHIRDISKEFEQYNDGTISPTGVRETFFM